MDADYEKIVYDKIRHKCADDIDADGLTGETDIDFLPMDSLTILEIVYELEDQLNITVEENLLINIRTVQDLVKVLARLSDTAASTQTT